MTSKEAIAIIYNEIACSRRDCTRTECASCDLALPTAEPIIEAFGMAIKALESQEGYDENAMVKRIKNQRYEINCLKNKIKKLMRRIESLELDKCQESRQAKLR